MKVVQGDEAPRKRGLEHRGGTFHGRILLEGEEGSPGNFQFSLGETGGDFYSPRHRHNFEQFRFQMIGTLDFARDGKMKPGMLGYFPEGVAYGPQSQDPAEQPLTAVLQFGGASGSGYLSQAEVKAGMMELAAFGDFTDGVFRRHGDVEGRRNSDAYQAIWEHANARPMTYPSGRYEKPVFMASEHFAWVPIEGMAGVSEKLLGIFTERRSAASLLRIDAGAGLDRIGRSVHLVVCGAGTVAGEPIRALTAIHLEAGESARFQATETITLLCLGLPDLSGLDMLSGAGLMAQAAE